jgi:hypothetical protein
MALISKSFPRSTRPSLQTSRHPPAPAGKSLKARALTRPSLQTSPPPAGDCVAAVAPLGDCSRSIQDACADTRASSRDGLAPTCAAPGPGSRGSRHRSAAWPAASIAVARADSPQHCSTIAKRVRPRTPTTSTASGNPGAPAALIVLITTAPHRAGPIRPVDADRVGGSIPVSTPGSILVSVKVWISFASVNK